MKRIFVTTKQGDFVLLSLAHIISVRQLREGCEIQVAGGLLYETSESLQNINEAIYRNEE